MINGNVKKINMIQKEELTGKFSASTEGLEIDSKDFISKWGDEVKKGPIRKEKTTMQEDGNDIIPTNQNILIKPFEKNPYFKKYSDSGILLEENGTFKNPDSGKDDKMAEGIKYAIVEEVGPDCRYLKKGDGIMYISERTLPIPFNGRGLRLLNEGHVLALINKKEDIDERFRK